MLDTFRSHWASHVRRALPVLLAAVSAVCGQSTASLQGTITDASGAVVVGAKVSVHNLGTGEDRNTESDSAGIYAVPSLPVGTYRITVSSPGLQTEAANNLRLEVGTTGQNFTLGVAASSEVVNVSAEPPPITTDTVTVGTVIGQKTVQDIPLNGRHFLDMSFLAAGSVTPPQKAQLAQPYRGQGFLGFNTAGAREDDVNYMVNGINLSDSVQNQITFQPTINTIEEFKIDNSTYTAEYGRNSGAIINIATRSGTNQWHGEVYEFVRNDYFDARNFSDPVGTPLDAFKRNQYGGDFGGPIQKDKTFFFLSYEGLRQVQGIPYSTTVLTATQRAQAATVGDPTVQKLLSLIPAANTPGGVYVGSASAPVNNDQGTVNVSHTFSTANRFNAYFATQADLRTEPPSTGGNNLPGYGDQRNGTRQLLTLNDTQVLTSTFVNEARLGYNRIKLDINPQDSDVSAASYGIITGFGSTIGLPQINVGGAFIFGNGASEPQGRDDYTAVASDSASWVRGKHSIKFGGDIRRLDADSYVFNLGSYTFPNVQAFINDQATAFSANPSNQPSRTYSTDVGLFVQDAYKVSRRLLLDLGLRYDWYGTPTEAKGRQVVFVPTTDSLVQVGHGIGSIFNQNARNFAPRVGFSLDVFGNGKTVVRSAYAIFEDQPALNVATGLSSNPPFAQPISFSPSAAIPNVSLTDALALAGAVVSPNSIAHSYRNANVQSWNFNVQQELSQSLALTAGYFGNKGSDLNIARNYNQYVDGLRPYPTLSANSPIDPGARLGTITVYESVGNSSYNGLWLTLTKRFSHGLQFMSSYTWSKSIDDNSRNEQGLTLQNSYDVNGDRGLSDFDARNRWVLSGIYELPFHGNVLKDGWQFSTIATLQSGNPINFNTTNSALTGTATLRPSVDGLVQTGFSPATNGNPSYVTYIQNPGVFYNQGNAFGNLGRNVIIGPGFSNLDLALTKMIPIRESIRLQFRCDAFDLLNHANYGQPGSTVVTSTLGLISGTRFPTGDSGSSRQLQLSVKLMF